MKKLNAYLFTFSSSWVVAGVCLALMAGCTKPPVEPCDPMPCDTLEDNRLGLLDTLWTEMIGPDTALVSIHGVFFQNDRVVVGYSFGLTAGLLFFLLKSQS
jgi:hypothetical protein